MGKIVNTVMFLVLGYVVPLLGAPGRILDLRIGILMLASILIFLTQPGFQAQEARTKKSSDQNSVWLILGLSLASVILPVVEWGYGHPDRFNTEIAVLGVLLIVVGLSIRIWAIRTLGKFFTATVQIKEQHQLVTHGPYSLVRHPSYLGAFLGIFGCAVILESWWMLPLSVIAMLFAYDVRIKHEERALIASFGKKYEQYRQQTKRMIPFIW